MPCNGISRSNGRTSKLFSVVTARFHILTNSAQWPNFPYTSSFQGLAGVREIRFSHVWLSETLWTVSRQASLSMGFSRQEYWGGLPCLPPGDLPDPRTEPTYLISPALAGGFFTPVPPGSPWGSWKWKISVPSVQSSSHVRWKISRSLVHDTVFRVNSIVLYIQIS